MKLIALAVCVVATACALPAQAQVAGFSDVPAKHWAAESIRQLSGRGILPQPPPIQQAPPIQRAPAGTKPTIPATPKPKSTPKPKFDGNKPVTRYELAVTLYRFVKYIEHADAQGKTKYGADNLPTDGPAAVKRLIAEGYLPADTPLAKDGARAITANQFADALASIIERSREKITPISPDLKGQPIEKPESPAKG